MKKTARYDLLSVARVRPAPVVCLDGRTRVRHFAAGGWGGAVVDRGRKVKSRLFVKGDWT